MNKHLDDVPAILYVLAAIITVLLSYTAPDTLAAHFGWVHGVQAWVMGQEPWIKALLILIYVLCVAFVVVFCMAAVVAIWYVLTVGISSVLMWVANTIRRTVELIFLGMRTALLFACRCAVWPFVVCAQWFGSLLNWSLLGIRSSLKERKELRRLYEEEYSHQFRSFARFRRYYEAVQNGEEPHPFDEKPGKSSEDEEVSDADAFQEAVRLLGLKDGFDEAELASRYRTLMKGVHPDVAGPNELAMKLNLARNLIKERMDWA